MATRYCCYLLDIDRIAAVCVIECDDDAAALQEAGRIVDTSPCSAAEVWDRTRKVSIIWKKNVAARAAMLQRRFKRQWAGHSGVQDHAPPAVARASSRLSWSAAKRI